MSKEKLIFAFDLGKASLGICIRRGAEILELQSLIVPTEYGMTSDFRIRRRFSRTRIAHKKREKWFQDKWQDAGLAPLKSDDSLFTKEFPKAGDDTLYNSALLRIALLQNEKLAPWQMYKALWSSIQRRGYVHCDWERKKDDVEGQNKDTQENLESVTKYTEELYVAVNSRPEYLYPCYLEATLMGLWSWENPRHYERVIKYTAEPVKGRVAPRELVEKEIRQLFENAKKQLPQLASIITDELIYGPAHTAFASLKPQFARYRGTEWDTQGVLSQKVPRFDNRIIGKCRMLPKRNVCKANEPWNLQFNLLMQLKNIRFTDEDGVIQRALTSQELNAVYKLCEENLAKKKTQELTAGTVLGFFEKVSKTKIKAWNLRDKEKIKCNASGRSSFCRPALKVMNAILISGQSPSEFDITPYLQENVRNGITRQELEDMISRLGESWEKFSIRDARYLDLEQRKVLTSSSARRVAVMKIIGRINNPVVRHRLVFFYAQLQKLVDAHGTPDEVILEFVRGDEGLESNKKGSDWEKLIKDNERINDTIRKKLDELGLSLTKGNIERLKLLQEQQGLCAYTGAKLSESLLSTYQVDHIVPYSEALTTDSYYNKVLCTLEANREKRNRTPYEWLQSDSEKWNEFLSRVTGKNSLYGSKKRQLLIRKDARELIENYNGLAETAYIARVTQQLIAVQFGWGLQTSGQERRVFVTDGRTTARIRKKYGLNELLLTSEEKEKLSQTANAAKQRDVWKKNRTNRKHHAVDAYCVSYSREIYTYQDESTGQFKWAIQGLPKSKAQFEEKLTNLFPLNTRRSTKELYPQDTIYGYKKRRDDSGKEMHYLTVQKDLLELVGKDSGKISKIYDSDIREDLSRHAERIKDNSEWIKFLKEYCHPKRQSRIKRLLTIEMASEIPPEMDESGRMQFGEFKDFGVLGDTNGKGRTLGQFKHSKQNTGQLIYQLPGGKWDVKQIYVHTSPEKVRRALLADGAKLYLEGVLFYSLCPVRVEKPLKNGKYPPGLYTVRTIRADRQVQLETHQGEKFFENIQNLIDAGMIPHSVN